jgi:hypothetical protein
MLKHYILQKKYKEKLNYIENSISEIDLTDANNIEFIDIKNARIGLIYVYYERDNQQKNQTNLSFFIKYGLNQENWLNLNITYLFVINNHQCEVVIPKRDDIHVLKEHNCHDYEGWYNGIKYFENLYKANIWDQFDYLCLMNAGTNGPFMNEDPNNHWLLPFYNKMIETNSIACSPYINNLPTTSQTPGMHLSCHFTLLKINKNIINILTNTKFIINKLYENTAIGYKKDKLDAIFTGEYGLSSILQLYNYKICCLYYENNIPVQYSNEEREEFYHENNEILKKTIFIKNIWRFGDDHYASIPVLYEYCTNYMFEKLNIKNIFYESNLNYELLKIKNDTDLWTSKENYYNLYGHAEENIIFPIQISNKSCVIYAHYDTNNIIADYVISSIKALISVGYNIIFYTASNKINNINLDTIPFKINFFKNQGVGTDWKIWLAGLINIKKNKINYDWILLLNDSILMPINGIKNLKNTIDTMRINSDFWGHWDSPELRWHVIGTPIEFKYNLIEDIIIFISNTLKYCKQDFDYISKMETCLTEYLVNKGYTYNVVIKHDSIISKNIYPCPSHNPYLINQWINNKSSFAIKWKYSISYLNKDIVSPEFNYLTRFLYYGPHGTISKGELTNVFPKSFNFIN